MRAPWEKGEEPSSLTVQVVPAPRGSQNAPDEDRGPAGLTRRGARPTGPAPDGGLAEWAGELAADGAARERGRAHWLQQQARDEGTFMGVLEDLAERGRPLVVHLHNGRLHRGVIVAVGVDHVGLRRTAGREVLVAQSAIASVRTQPREAPVDGDRPVRSARTLGEALVPWADQRTRVLVAGADAGQAVSGELRAVGRDLLTLRLDGDGGVAYIALESVAEVSAAVSGAVSG